MKRVLFALLFAGTSGLLGCDKLPRLGPSDEGKLATASQEDCGYVQNNYGQRVSWKKNFPVKIYMDPGFPEEYVPVLKSAASRWEAVVQHPLFQFERATNPSAIAWDGKNVLYWQNPWDGENYKNEGITSLSWYRNQVMEADIRINAANYQYFVNESAGTLTLHLESLLVHELGHFLGLKHLKSSSVMLEILDYGIKREIPTEEDKAHLLCEYN